MVLSRQQQFNEKHCICCFSSFGFILNRKIQCQVCRFFICKNCRAKSEKKEDILCIACVQQQELQVRACEWFYAQIRAKFRRFGSAKVVRSLYKRDKERGSGSEDEDSQNSDSGVGRQRSPDSLGSSFDLSAFMQGPRNDQETNTAAVSSIAVLSHSSPEYQDWLDLLRPPMTSVAVQAPHDEDNSLEDIIKPSVATEDRCSIPDRCTCKSGKERNGSSSPSLIVYDPKGDKVCKEKEKSEQVPPPVANGRGGDAMLFHILSPIEEMSSPECSDRGESGSKPGSPAVVDDTLPPVAAKIVQDVACCHGGDGSKECTPVKEEGDDELDAGRHGNDEGEQEEDEESMISPRELDSGIHLAFSNSMDGDMNGPCPDAIEADKMLSQRLKMQNIGCSESFESVSSASFSLLSLDANDTLDSLETHIHSSHSDLHSPPPDIHEDFDSTNSTLTGKVENAEDEWKLSEAEKTNLSRSSSEDTLKSDEDEEGLGPRELSMEEFLDQIQTRTTSMTEEEESKYEDEEQDPSIKSFQDGEEGCASREEELENRDHVSLNLEFHPRSFYKRSRSSDDFRNMRDEDHNDDPGSNSDGEDTKAKSKGKHHRNGKFNSNRFIRYDSLPLVVEVYEADSNSPSFSPSDVTRSRFVYDSQDSESPNRGSPKRQVFSPSKSGKHNQPKKSKDVGQSRQTSVESTTTESTLPKSTPISSGPTTPDFECKRKNSLSTVSSESEGSPDTLKRDKILFTRQLLQQHKEYHQSEGIRPSTTHKLRSLSHSDADPLPYRPPQGGMASHGQLQKQLSLPKQGSLHDDEEEILAGYRRLKQHDSTSQGMSASGEDADPEQEGFEDEDEERDYSCGMSNSDEITGLLSEQDVFDSSDNEEEDFEDANSTLTDDINGNDDSNHNEDIASVQDTDGARKVSSRQEEEKDCLCPDQEHLEESISESFPACIEDQSSSPNQDPKDTDDALADTINASTFQDDSAASQEDLNCKDLSSSLQNEEVCYNKIKPEEREESDIGRAEADVVNDEEDAVGEKEEMTPKMLKRKEEADLANLTYKLSIKQGEVLQSAEEVLSSANQLSNIQNEVDALDYILTSLERKVAKGVLSSQTSSEYDESEGGDLAVSPQELVKEDLCDLEVRLSQTDDDNPDSQINMATAVRMITATALKVLNTTEAAIELQQDDTIIHARLVDDNILDQEEEQDDEGDDDDDEEEEEENGRIDGETEEDREKLEGKNIDLNLLSDLCDDLFSESESVEDGYLNSLADVLIDIDNNVFQCGLEPCGDVDGELSVEKDKNANAVHLSPQRRLCDGRCGSEFCKMSAMVGKTAGNKSQASDSKRPQGDTQHPGEKDSVKDLRDRKGVPKDSLKLSLPSAKPQEMDKRKQTNDKSATPSSASSKPKSPEATISPGSRHSSSPSSGPILHLTSGPTSPPTATLLFSSDELVWDSAVPVSSSDSESMVPTEMVPNEGKNPRDAARVETLDFTPSPSKRHKSEVSVFESSFTPTNGDGDFSPDFLSAFYDRVSELEERVYLSAGKVFTLEERLEQLEMEVNSVDCTLPDDIMAILEDKVAMTVAQVQQCEREVHTVEDNISSLDHTQDGIFSTMYSVDHIPTTPRKLETISSASFLLNHPDEMDDEMHGHAGPLEMMDETSSQAVEVTH
ncbi:uncharacterized protein LOC121417713 [Lytechinus variegatus]|uniref:uncharacterized protein LOC121417713 n=1 Tax=Lytechinus variegatus TaxID=7654 RepID=UPI001BB21261|nr:uncharacterized protein LOC121417713 [Lytechinus variegatus]